MNHFVMRGLALGMVGCGLVMLTAAVGLPARAECVPNVIAPAVCQPAFELPIPEQAGTCYWSWYFCWETSPAACTSNAGDSVIVAGRCQMMLAGGSDPMLCTDNHMITTMFAHHYHSVCESTGWYACGCELHQTPNAGNWQDVCDCL